MHTTDQRQPERRPEFNPTVRAVRDAILSFDRDDPTRAEIAQVAGVSVATVKRAVKKLCDAGMLKSEAQFRNNKQVSNSYQVPTSIGDLMPGQNDPAIYVLSSEEEDPAVVDPDVDQELDHSDLPETTSTVCEGVQSPALGFAQCTQDQEPPQDGGARALSGIGSGIFAELHRVNQLVDAFASRVNRVGPSRRRKFWNTAYGMLIEDRLAPDEILDVIDHAFAHQDRLAYELDGADETGNDWDRGITRLKQIADFYPDIRADMARSS